MKTKRIFCVLFLCCIIFNAHAYAKSPVWKISKDGYHLFLGGTIHLLTESDYPLPGAFETAYNNSMLLVLETDLQKFGSPEFQQTILQKTMYAGEQNITQFLKPDTIQALKKHLTSRGIPTESMLKFKPGMLSAALTMVELQRLGLMGTGVDEFFNLRALNEKREIKYLETVYDQLEFLSKMGEGNENELIKYTLKDLKDLPRLFGSMKEAWVNGDNTQLQKVALDPWRGLFPKLYNSILVERNNNWIPQIERMLKTKEVEFVLFGALHLAG
ncbi:MAG: TraB/GumN family protein, partial [Desulfobacterales bacterium]|nr:TraB/GumN family protein [Desulfobacterales bacterium]